MDLEQREATWFLSEIRRYWESEGCLHQRLDVTAKEDSSRVRHRNALQILGMARRAMMGIYLVWRRGRRNQRQSTLKDYYDAMDTANHRAGRQKSDPQADIPVQGAAIHVRRPRAPARPGGVRHQASRSLRGPSVQCLHRTADAAASGTAIPAGEK